MLSRVGKYEVIGEIGHGGMATVYRARDTHLNRMVALKVMHPHLQGAKEARVRFSREALTIARLRHPSILEIYDYSGEDSEISYIAAELLTGPTLRHFAEQHPDIPAEIAACMVIPVARALAAAHLEGVVHRDVKPENVLLHENRIIKLTDFGIAQLVDMQGMTTTGQVLGSPAHMAPEQIEGRECDARSDLFSLGTVLYLLATGQLPFQGRNPHQVLKQIADGYFRDPLQIKPQLGGRLAAILRRCLQLDPLARYANARELELDLLAFVAEAGIGDPDKELIEYLKDPGAFTQAFTARVIESQTELGERLLKAGQILPAMDAWNRVLAFDERNARVLFAVQRVGRRSRLRKVALWGGAALGVMLVLGVAYVTTSLPKPDPSAILAQRTDRGVRAQPAQPSARPSPNLRPSQPGATQPAPAATVTRPRETRPPRPSGAPVNAGTGPRHVVFDPEPANVSISINGSLPRDFGPSFRALDLPPGTHKLKFIGAHDCCVDEEISVKIPPGPGTTVVAHRLKYRPAGLYVISNTPANVVVDGGDAEGRTRSVIQVPQPNSMFGMHQVRVSAEGHQEVMREVRLRAGQVETIQIKLSKLSTTAPPPG